jgi:hypothetical protein
MDQGPLVIDQIDVGTKFLSEFQKYAPIQAAFWLKDSEEGHWHLYVASNEITDDNFDVAYGEVIRIARVLRDPRFDPFQIKVISDDVPLAKAAMNLHQRYPGQVPIRVRDKKFGNLFAEEVYLYPSPEPAPTK